MFKQLQNPTLAIMHYCLRRICLSGSAGARWISTSRANDMKVSVLGAAGGIGQPLSLLLKQSSLISHLALFDLVSTPGVAADLSHINTSTRVRIFMC